MVSTLATHLDAQPAPTSARAWLHTACLLAACSMAGSDVDLMHALTTAQRMVTDRDAEPTLDARTLHALAAAAAHTTTPCSARTLYTQLAAEPSTYREAAPLALALPALARAAARDPTAPADPPPPALAKRLLEAAAEAKRGAGCLAAAAGGVLVAGGVPTRQAVQQAVQGVLDVCSRRGAGVGVLGLVAVLGGRGLPALQGGELLEQGAAVRSALQVGVSVRAACCCWFTLLLSRAVVCMQCMLADHTKASSQYLQGMASDPDAPHRATAALSLALLCEDHHAQAACRADAQVAGMVQGSTCGLLVERLKQGACAEEWCGCKEDNKTYKARGMMTWAAPQAMLPRQLLPCGACSARLPCPPLVQTPFAGPWCSSTPPPEV